jgi:ABC-2 type transport system permease protein
MSNTLNIARKEFVDLLSNRMVLIVLIAFIIYVVSTVYLFYTVLTGGKPGVQLMFHDNTGVAAANYVFYTLSWFGTIIGLIVGCSTISSERIGSALNTLVVKPVYRDTIINGKLLGAVVFLASVMVFFIAIFTSGFLILCGNALVPFMLDYLSRLLFVFLFIMVFVGVFLSLSVLISLLVRDQAFAMILSTLTVYISLVLDFPDVSSNLNNILPGYGLDNLISGISLYGILWRAQPVLMNTGSSAYDAFISIFPDFIKLLLFAVIALVISYIVFLRRDIS